MVAPRREGMKGNIQRAQSMLDSSLVRVSLYGTFVLVNENCEVCREAQ